MSFGFLQGGFFLKGREGRDFQVDSADTGNSG